MKYNFYKRGEIKTAKHESRNPEPSFSLTTNIGIKWYIKHLALDEDYIWMEV